MTQPDTTAPKDPPRTFRAAHDNRTSLIQHQWMDPLDPEGLAVVWVDPLERPMTAEELAKGPRGATGGTMVQLGFPCAVVTAVTSGGLQFAELIARLLTEHYAREAIPVGPPPPEVYMQFAENTPELRIRKWSGAPFEGGHRYLLNNVPAGGYDDGK